MPRYRIALACTAIIASSCASRPSEDQLSISIQNAASSSSVAEVTTEVADCIASGLLSSELSDTTLQGLSENFSNAEVLVTEMELTAELISDFAASCSNSTTPAE